MDGLHLVPPLTPAQAAAREPVELERLDFYPDGNRVSGRYVQWRGQLYSSFSKLDGLWIEYRDTGPAPAGWEARRGSYDPRSGKSTFRRRIDRTEVERHVVFRSTGAWQGFNFVLGEFLEDGTVMVWGHGEVLADLIDAGKAPGLETMDRGRSVTGVLPWAELADVVHEVTELPLP